MILASGSPRRVAILRQAGIEAEVRPQDVDETPLAGEGPQALVERLARAKAASCLASCGAGDVGKIVVAADTVVWLDGFVLGKPADARDARRMLRLLSGRTHHVSTGVCFAAVGQAHEASACTSFVETTDVRFLELSDSEIDDYVASGEPLDKAGAYGYQALGCRLVEGIRGDYYNVVGLPIARLLRALAWDKED